MALNLFVPIDVDYASDRKIIAAGVFGEALYIRSLALAKRTLEDGKIYSEQLAELCLRIPGKAQTHADTLVRVGLWQSTPYGWVIAAWSKRNPTAKSVRDKAERKRQSALKANHERWHVGPDTKPSDSCPLCYPDAIRLGSESESTEEQEQEEPEEQEYPDPVVGSSDEYLRSPLGDGQTDDDVGLQALGLLADMLTDKLCDSPKQGARKKYRDNVINDPEHLPALRALVEAYPFSPAADIAAMYEDGEQPLTGGSSRHPVWCECEGSHLLLTADGYVKCPHTSWDHLPDATILELRGAS